MSALAVELVLVRAVLGLTVVLLPKPPQVRLGLQWEATAILAHTPPSATGVAAAGLEPVLVGSTWHWPAQSSSTSRLILCVLGSV